MVVVSSQIDDVAHPNLMQVAVDVLGVPAPTARIADKVPLAYNLRWEWHVTLQVTVVGGRGLRANGRGPLQGSASLRLTARVWGGVQGQSEWW